MKKHIVLLNTVAKVVRKWQRQFSNKALMLVFSSLGFVLALLLAQFSIGFSGCIVGICHNSSVGQAATLSQILYISPQGAGKRDGSSAQNAGLLTDLPAFVSRVQPGGEVRLLTGVYKHSGNIRIASGGSAGKPITIHGTDASGIETSMPVIVGDRSSPYQAPPLGKTGNSLFNLLPGASYLTFRNIHCMNQGNGCFVFAGTKGDVTIEKTKATNVQRFIEHDPNSSKTTGAWDLANVTIRNADIQGYSKGAIRFGKSKPSNQADAHNILIEQVVGDSQRQDGDNFCMGVHLRGDVHHVTLRRTTMNNCQQTLSEKDYWNGDGFTAEANVSDLRFEDTSAAGNTDGGYDIKAKNTVLIRAKAADNKRNFRFWSKIDVQDCVGVEPRCRGGSGCLAQIHATESADVTLTRCNLKSTNPLTKVFQSDKNAKITVQGGTVQHRGILQKTEGSQNLVKITGVKVEVI
ncbi:hypothetical protein H6G64_22450 [Calothrix sp. FACHB-156]|nr:hypothetical protein [Nostoc linckia FACHB-104]MBD2339737.1 hypothetical protein [Calothrix sp. FACHB-156]